MYHRMFIYEGQFKDNMLNGFGRMCKIWEGYYAEVIGYWENDYPHGYGRFTSQTGEYEIGLWEHGMSAFASSVQSYDGKKDKIAQEINFT